MSEDSPIDSARKRQSERADHVENILSRARLDLGDVEYPVRREELAEQYANEPVDLPNETESLGSVFDRLTQEEYESEREVREALYGELTGEGGGPQEANEERALSDPVDDPRSSDPVEDLDRNER